MRFPMRAGSLSSLRIWFDPSPSTTLRLSIAPKSFSRKMSRWMFARGRSSSPAWKARTIYESYSKLLQTSHKLGIYSGRAAGFDRPDRGSDVASIKHDRSDATSLEKDHGESGAVSSKSSCLRSDD